MQTPPRHLCVLVVEDNPDSLRLVSRLLRSHGYVVHEAMTCEQALDVIERERCELLLSDISLPDCSGLDLMRDLRKRHPRVRGVAVSGHAGPDHAEAASQAGFDRYLTKPVNVDELLDAVRRVLG